MTMPAGWKPPNERMVLGKEETLWSNEKTKGIFKKTVMEVQILTNYRVIRNDYGIMLQEIEDVVVINQQSFTI
jgi:hypothetical protein